MKRLALWILLAGMTLGIFRGHVALWRNSSPDPEAVYPYSAALLPPEDQAALARGIPADSPEALARLLEDFLS